MDILKEVKDSWGWVGIEPTEIIEENGFGNLILKDTKGRFWRLCPEDVYCKIIANSIDEYNELVCILIKSVCYDDRMALIPVFCTDAAHTSSANVGVAPNWKLAELSKSLR